MKEREPLPVLLQIYILALLISLSGLGVSALCYWFGWWFAMPLASGSGFLLIAAFFLADTMNFPGSFSGKKPPEREK